MDTSAPAPLKQPSGGDPFTTLICELAELGHVARDQINGLVVLHPPSRRRAAGNPRSQHAGGPDCLGSTTLKTRRGQAVPHAPRERHNGTFRRAGQPFRPGLPRPTWPRRLRNLVARFGPGIPNGGSASPGCSDDTTPNQTLHRHPWMWPASCIFTSVTNDRRHPENSPI